jgi:pyruvate/2-oxoglutarate dehydrogenase complex dihydrolipoamide dehydrogenase (E3) component
LGSTWRSSSETFSPGGASILGPTKIRVANPNGEHILTTDQIFVATGSRPHDPTPSHSMIARLR